MSHSHSHQTDRLWHECLTARNVLASLGPGDVRLIRVRDGPGPDSLDWHPDSDFGAATFIALMQLRQAAVGPAFAMAHDACTRAVALEFAQRAPTVTSAVATRFGEPARWHGYGPIEATRRFRANWT